MYSIQSVFLNRIQQKPNNFLTIKIQNHDNIGHRKEGYEVLN